VELSEDGTVAYLCFGGDALAAILHSCYDKIRTSGVWMMKREDLLWMK